jgi:hypothetical protein
VGRSSHGWEDKIGVDLREVRWEGVDWLHVDHGKDWWQVLVNMVMNLWIP